MVVVMVKVKVEVEVVAAGRGSVQYPDKSCTESSLLIGKCAGRAGFPGRDTVRRALGGRHSAARAVRGHGHGRRLGEANTG